MKVEASVPHAYEKKTLFYAPMEERERGMIRGRRQRSGEEFVMEISSECESKE